MTKATVLFDVSRLVWRAWGGRLPTGIDRTCLAYIAHYGERAQAVVQWKGVSFLLPSSLSRRLFDLLLEPGENMRRDLIRLLATTNPFRFSEKRPGWFYLNVGHTGLDRPGHAAWIRHMGVRPIYFVHDLIPLTHPEYCRPGEPEKHLLRIKAMLDHGAGVIGNSGDTINELTVFAKARNGLGMPQTVVAPLGVTAKAQSPAQERPAIVPNRPYFVMLGTIEGRKNHLLILNVWAKLVRRLGPVCPQLVVIGQRGWECEQVVDMLERCKAIHDHVIELPRCDDIQLRSLMAGAQALLFPSFVEGYGLPLVEALADGTPVIASDLGVFRELAGDIPDYRSPIDGLGWMRAIEDYAREDSPMRAAQMARMSGWAAPTWEDHFARVDAFLDELSHRPK